MARGFNSVGSGGTTDIVTTAAMGGSTLRSYSIWAYRIAGIDGARMFDKPTNEELFFHDTLSSIYTFQRKFSTTNGNWNIPQPSANAWHHIALRYDSALTTNIPVMDVDGINQTVSTFQTPNGTAQSTSSAFSLGNRAADLIRTWNGHLAEFAVWDRLLGDTEVQQLAKGMSPLTLLRGLVEYVPLVRDPISYFFAPATVSGAVVTTHPSIYMPNVRWVGKGELQTPIDLVLPVYMTSGKGQTRMVPSGFQPPNR